MSKLLFGSSKVPELSYLLKEVSLDDLHTISKMLGSSGSLKSRARLINSIPNKLLDSKFVKKYISSLPQEEMTALKIFFYMQSYAPDLLSTVRRKMSGLINSLRDRGLIFYMGKAKQYFMPREIVSSIDGVVSVDLECISLNESGGKEINHGFAMLRDVFTVFSQARSGKIRMTKAGNAFSNSVDKLSNLLELSSHQIPSDIMEPDKRIQFILEYLKVKGLIALAGKKTISTDVNITNWSRERYLEFLNSIARFYFFEFNPPNNIVKALTIAFVVAMSQHKSSSIFKYNDFVELVIKTVRKIETSVSAKDIRETIATLTLFGILKLVERDRGDGALGISDIGLALLKGMEFIPQVNNELYILPDFNIIASKDVELSLRATLETFLELVSLKETITFKLTRQSAYQGFKAGYTSEGIINILKDNSSKPLPQNIEYSLVNWYNLYKKASFKKGIFIAVDSDEVADEILSNKQLRQYVKEVVRGPVLILKDGAYDRTFSVLTRMGFMPKPLHEDDTLIEQLSQQELSTNNISLALENCAHLGREVYMIYKNNDTIWRGYVTPRGITEKEGRRYARVRKRGTKHNTEVLIDEIMYVSFED